MLFLEKIGLKITGHIHVMPGVHPPPTPTHREIKHTWEEGCTKRMLPMGTISAGFVNCPAYSTNNWNTKIKGSFKYYLC